MCHVLFLHPRIRLLHSGRDYCGGMLVRDGRIVALGSEAQLLADAPAGTRVVRLPGEVVIPGFHDAHTHIGSLARELDAPELREARSLAEVASILTDWRETHPGTGWVVGGRWDRNLWPQGEMPRREVLDSVFGERPVALPSVDGHSLWANSAALRIIEIDEEATSSPGGKIVRDAETHQPTGLLLELAGESLRALAEATLANQLASQLLRAQDHLLSRGVTHVTNFEEEAVRLAFEQLRSEGALAIRAHLGIAVDELDEAIAVGRRTGDGDEWITTGPAKLYADGALGSHTAHLTDPFEDEPGNHGIEVTDVNELAELVGHSVRNGIAVATHAIGDRANGLVLDAYERHRELTAAAGLTNRIEHAQHIRWADIPRFARLNVVASMQPTHCTSDYLLGEELLGTRSLAQYAWRSLIDSGALVAFGSDTPIEPIDPLTGVHSAVTRQNLADEPAGGREPAERVTLTEALRAFTEAPARAAGLGNVVGRFAPGQLADFVVLDKDPFAVEAGELPHLKVQMTVVHGEIRHRTN